MRRVEQLKYLGLSAATASAGMMEYVELNQRAKVRQVRIRSPNHQEAVSFRGDAKAELGHVPSNPTREPEEVAGLDLLPPEPAAP